MDLLVAGLCISTGAFHLDRDPFPSALFYRTGDCFLDQCGFMKPSLSRFLAHPNLHILLPGRIAFDYLDIMGAIFPKTHPVSHYVDIHAFITLLIYLSDSFAL